MLSLVINPTLTSQLISYLLTEGTPSETTPVMSLNILLVEDNLDLSETVVQFLEIEDMICDLALSAEAGLSLIQQHSYDVVVLDIMLPRMSGFELCKRLRAHGFDSPILMLTARDTLHDKIEGFEAGADDYLVKPFDLPELVVRIKALSKRRSGQTHILSHAGLSMNLDTHEATRNKRTLRLSPTGWKLLELLLREAPATVTRARILRSLWGDDQPESNSLKVHLHMLRKQVDAVGEPQLLHTISNQGYAIRSNTQEGAEAERT